MRFKTLFSVLLVGLTVLAGCGEDTSKRTLAFTTQPSDGTADQALSSFQITLRNEDGKTVTDAKGEVELSLYAGPEGATLEGTLRQPLSKGQATFSDISVPKVGSGFVLKAAFSGKEAVSTPFAVSHGAAKGLEIVVGPSEATVGQPIAPTVQVRVVDAHGNAATGASGEVSATLVDPANTGAQILGARTATVSQGVATFSDLMVDKVGDFTLKFSAASLKVAESTPFKVKPGNGLWLAFTSQPASATAGELLGTVKVEARDSHGNVDDRATGEVLVKLGSANGASLSGTQHASFTQGVATFADLKVVKAGSGYTLEASSGQQRIPATSQEFVISPAAAAKVSFAAAPSAATAGVGFSPAPSVHVEDAFGNATSGTVHVDLVSPPAGVTLQGTTQADATSGDVTFSGLSLQKAGSYTLRATVGASGPSATSGAFSVTAAAASSVQFTASPTSAVAGKGFSPAVSVQVTDAFGNAAQGTVHVGLLSAPTGVTLQGLTDVEATNGQATFSGLSLQKAGSYTLQATVGASGPSGASQSLNVSAAPAEHVSFTAGPTAAVAGSAFSPAVSVQVTDAFGNLADGTVRLELAAAPTSAALQGTTELAVTNGLATFDGLSAQRAGSYRLRSVVVGGGSATGDAFTVTHAAPAQLAFATQPQGGPSNLPLSQAPVVEVSDAYGNLASTASGTVTVALGNNPASAALKGTLSVPVANGRAAFKDLGVDQAGTGYTLRASLDVITADSAGFDVGAAITALVYTDPTGGDLRLVRNPASTPTLLVLDLVASKELKGFGVGFNLPADASRVRLATDGFVPGSALPPGHNPMAAKAVLPASGPMQGVLVTAQSQKADGAGAVPTDSTIAQGTVLYTLKLELAPGATPGTVFDGTTGPIAAFNGALRTRAGVDVVSRNGFGIGRLIVIGP
ncbi:MAG: hypothetical protein ACJ8AT_01195 [Hyalangium sp.]|uniref:hypothetical protein n=1 Tax=Hyalangium sp. TaxID=2028555 RepID=UPI00389AB243